MTCQFISRDPAVAATGQPYAYVVDNPVNSTDPTGLWCAGWTAGGTGFGGSWGGTTSWSIGYCNNGDPYATRTDGNATRHNGSYVSAGLGVQASPNATCAQDLAKEFKQGYVGGGVGFLSGNASLSSGSGVHGQPVDVWEASYPVGTPGIGGGAGAADFDTYTYAYSSNFATDINYPLVSAATAIHPAATWVSSWL